MADNDWLDLWTTWHDMLLSHGAVVQALRVEPPALARDVRAVEVGFGRRLPASLRSVLLTFSREVHFKWFLHDGPAEPRQLKDLSRFGELHWSLDSLKRLRSDDEDAQDDIDMYGETGAQLLRHTVIFQQVANGDALAVDWRSGEVVYLDHEGGLANGIVLGASFAKFVSAYSAVGCAGPDSEQLRAILDEWSINPRTPMAESWRAWIGLPSRHRAT